MSSANLSQNRLPTEVWIEIFRSLYPSSDGLQQTLSQHREAFDHSASLTTSSLSKNDQRKYITALDPTRSIFTLSTVCSRWWRIITTYPVFWTFIVLDSPLRVPLVERCLARSGCLLLTVCIVCDSSEGIELLLSHSDRWKSAFVSPRLSDRINCSGRCFPDLEFFASSAWSQRGMMRFTIDVPRLSHYHALDDNAVPPMILDRLVHLTVSDWSLLHLLFVLEDAYCLQTLVILGGLSSDSTTVYNEKLEVPCLRALHLCLDTEQWSPRRIKMFLEILDCPSLETLSCSTDVNFQWTGYVSSLVCEFAQRVAASLTELHLFTGIWDEVEVLETLRTTQHLWRFGIWPNMMAFIEKRNGRQTIFRGVIAEELLCEVRQIDLPMSGNEALRVPIEITTALRDRGVTVITTSEPFTYHPVFRTLNYECEDEFEDEQE